MLAYRVWGLSIIRKVKLGTWYVLRVNLNSRYDKWYPNGIQNGILLSIFSYIQSVLSDNII